MKIKMTRRGLTRAVATALASGAIALVLTACGTTTTVVVEKPAPTSKPTASAWSASQLSTGLTSDGLTQVTVEDSTTSLGTYVIAMMPEDLGNDEVQMQGIVDEWGCYLPSNLPSDPDTFYGAYVKVEGWICGDNQKAGQTASNGLVLTSENISGEVDLFVGMTEGTMVSAP